MEPKKENFFIEIFKFAIIALVIVVPFRLYVAQPFIVSGESMSPTFETGEYLIVDQLTYHFEAPKRGDVVIFKYPLDTSKYFIKRIIGLPGETVSVKGATVTITDKNGNLVTTLTNEAYVLPANQSDLATNTTLTDDQYFVMGDNRRVSSDSRIWGPVPKEDMVGRAFLRLLPPSRVSLFPGAYSLSSAASASQ
jgi:signal peptidase I